MNKSLLSLLVYILITLTISCQNTKKESPNIIMILADDLGYNDLSCYRSINQPQSDKPPTCNTPNIDALAKDGLMFTDFYCGAAVCSPSRSSLLTGRNSTRVGIYNWIPKNSPMHLRSEEVTIAEMLKEKNYHTGHFGKWHLTSENTDQPLPNDQGFDYSFFTYNNAIPSHENPINFIRNNQEVGKIEGYSCQLVVMEAIEWLKTVKYSENPFYINIWFNEPHEKVAAPDSLIEKHNYNKKYYACIENMDIAVGKLRTFLKDNGMDKNTIIMFSSDNGSQQVASNDPLRGEKCFNYDGGVRVPFIVNWPGRVPSGEKTNAIGSFTDILLSISKITGTQLPTDRVLDGEDISSIFFGKTSTFERKKPIFFYRYFHEPISMLREGDWLLLGYDSIIPYEINYNQVELAKLKPAEGEPQWSMWGFQPVHMEFLKDIYPSKFELYDMKTDEGQRKDVSNTNPEIVLSMKEKMLNLQKEMVSEGGDWFKQ